MYIQKSCPPDREDLPDSWSARQRGSAKILDLPDREAPSVLCSSAPPKQRNAPEEKYPQNVDLAPMTFFTTHLLFILMIGQNQTPSVRTCLQIFSVLCTIWNVATICSSFFFNLLVVVFLWTKVQCEVLVWERGTTIVVAAWNPYTEMESQTRPPPKSQIQTQVQ